MQLVFQPRFLEKDELSVRLACRLGFAALRVIQGREVLMMTKKKYFTVEEANALLPFVKQELQALQAISRKYGHRHAGWERLRQGSPVDEQAVFSIECELDFLQIEARAHMQNISGQGAELKDIALGLVDFPAVREGQEVLLCWKLGEERIGHFHGHDEGFWGRKRLEE